MGRREYILLILATSYKGTKTKLTSSYILLILATSLRSKTLINWSHKKVNYDLPNASLTSSQSQFLSENSNDSGKTYVLFF